MFVLVSFIPFTHQSIHPSLFWTNASLEQHRHKGLRRHAEMVCEYERDFIDRLWIRTCWYHIGEYHRQLTSRSVNPPEVIAVVAEREQRYWVMGVEGKFHS
jgi:hypothetical protein